MKINNFLVKKIRKTIKIVKSLIKKELKSESKPTQHTEHK